MSQSSRKPKTLFEREMRKPGFRRAYEAERASFALEVQFLNLLEGNRMKMADLARALGVPRGNITRDLSQGGIQRATLPRIRALANAADADFVPVILPRDPEKRRTVLDRLEKAFATGAS
jgi:predicted XRE-type DNA-binding protein